MNNPENGFRLRGQHMSRVDGFSDVVFGFALTLLVVSLEVPRTYAELQAVMNGFFAFAICFALLIKIWFAHYTFFRRYGLEDTHIISLNAVLLFVVLFYVYPLKFLFFVFAGQFTGRPGESAHPTFTDGSQIAQLMMLYGLGYCVLYVLFFLLHLHCWRLREELELNPIERLFTRREMTGHLGEAAIGMICVGTAWVLGGERAGLAGFTFFLLFPFRTIHGSFYGRRLRALQAANAPSHPKVS